MSIGYTLKGQVTNKTKLDDELLNGKIKTLYEKAYVYTKNANDSLKLSYELTYTFNKKGLLIRRYGLGQDVLNFYNSENQLTFSRICLENGVEYIRNEFLYHNWTLVKHIRRDVPSKYVSSKYDYSVTLYTYNNVNNLIDEKRLNKLRNSRKEVLVDHKKYQYDKNGDCVIEEGEEDGKVIRRVNKKYSDHKLIESFSWQEFEGENLYLKDLYEYNKANVIISHINLIYDYNTTERIADQIIINYSYKYNNKQQLIEMSELSTKITTCNYFNFDVNGNWQRKIINKDGNLKVVMREFEYYK